MHVMARRTDIREEVQSYVDSLIELYEESDPSLGEQSEEAKLALARHAVEIWWRLHDCLMVWAQAQLTGYSILTNKPELAHFLNRKLGANINPDSHVLEQIGLQYAFNPPDKNDKSLNQTDDLLQDFAKEAANTELVGQDEGPHYLSPAALRMLVVELLVSRSANSSYWRFELQKSLRSLNEGETDEISAPSGGKRQGQPFSLKQWRLEAIRQVHFRVGKGLKKYRAREEVGLGIGQSQETLRDWEKELLRSEDYANDLFCSELAGRWATELKQGHFRTIPNYQEFGEHRGTNNVLLAQLLLGIIEKRSFAEIKSKIYEFRQKRSGGRKARSGPRIAVSRTGK